MSFDAAAAREAAATNDALRLRLARHAAEEEERSRQNHFVPADTTMVDTMRSKNNALAGEVSDLEKELEELRKLNVTELQHEYIRLNGRRAFLNNETTGLRRVLTNQQRGVSRATRALNDQQVLRKQNEEGNRAQREDMQELRERRDRSMASVRRLMKKEAALQEQLNQASKPGADYRGQIKTLEGEGHRLDQMILDLDAQIVVASRTLESEDQAGNDQKEDAALQEELIQLREEYTRLKNETSA